MRAGFEYVTDMKGVKLFRNASEELPIMPKKHPLKRLIKAFSILVRMHNDEFYEEVNHPVLRLVSFEKNYAFVASFDTSSYVLSV